MGHRESFGGIVKRDWDDPQRRAERIKALKGARHDLKHLRVSRTLIDKRLPTETGTTQYNLAQARGHIDAAIELLEKVPSGAPPG